MSLTFIFYKILKEDYSSGGEGEISLSQGDRLSVIIREPTGWWLVENYETGESGWVPASRVANLLS